MAFFIRQDIGRIYVLRMEMPDSTVIHKIGMCKTARTTDRMMEILRSWFMQYRFVPHTTLRLDMETGHPEKLEAHIHRILHRKQFIPNKKVEGGTEMFIDIDEFRVLHYLRSFNDSLLDKALDLSEQDYLHLGELISPD